SACRKSDYPQGTLKVALSTPGQAHCANQAIPAMENGIACEIEPSDICVDTKYFDRIYQWGLDKQKRINQLEAQLRTCH
ncbi:hypothetical protein QA786_15030, partial [Listeria monocytogenes]|uniref:hypothetical protein n=1 Tax=Listeria monocytogenes TaxID=1639 RepID=UPI002498FB16